MNHTPYFSITVKDDLIERPAETYTSLKFKFCLLFSVVNMIKYKAQSLNDPFD